MYTAIGNFELRIGWPTVGSEIKVSLAVHFTSDPYLNHDGPLGFKYTSPLIKPALIPLVLIPPQGGHTGLLPKKKKLLVWVIMLHFGSENATL